MDQLLAVSNQDGMMEEMVLYTPELARPVGGASDGVWLTGLPRMDTNPGQGAGRTGTRMPEAETGSGWRVVVVGALLVGGLWGVAVAWTLLALVRAM